MSTIVRSNIPTKKYEVLTICSAGGESEGQLRFVLIHIWKARGLGLVSPCARSLLEMHLSKYLMWEYELYGGAQLPVGPTSPDRPYVIARYLTPPKGVWEGPRALIHLPRNTRCRFLFPRAKPRQGHASQMVT
eukprot:scaffold410_cov125-Isochrysis_galbana.AAC.8